MSTKLPYTFVPLLMFDATKVPPARFERRCQNKLCRKRLIRGVLSTLNNVVLCGDKCADAVLDNPALITEEVEVWTSGERLPRPLNRGALNQWRPAMAKNEEQQVEAPAETPKANAQPQQNGVTRPKPGTATGRVWEIADELSRQAGKPADRAEVLKAYEAEGGNASTGATQFGRWRKFNGLGRYAPNAAATTEETAGAPEDAPEVEE